MFQTVFSVFFYAATITAAAAVFLYLFIKRLCMCVSAFIICCVCVQVTHFILLFSVFFFRLLKNSLIYSQLKRKNQQLYYLSFCVLVCSCLHGCCVFVWFSFLLIIVGFLDAYTLYICVCVCVLCVIIIATEKEK